MTPQKDSLRLTANGYENRVLAESTSRKVANRNASRGIQFGVLQLLLAVSVYCAWYFHSLPAVAALDESTISLVSFVLGLLLAGKGLFNVVRFIAIKFFSSSIEVTAAQKVLLGIKDRDIGFRVSSPKKGESSCATPTVTFSPSLSLHYHASPLVASAHGSYLSSPGSSVLSATLPYGSQLSSPGSLDTTVSSSFTYVKPSSQNGGASRPFSLDDSGASALLRCRAPSRPSPSGKNEHFSCLEELDSFLDEQEIKDQQEQLARSEVAGTASPSFWSYARTAADYIPQLRKYQYQMAPRSPQSKAAQNDDGPGHLSKCSANETWSALGVRQNTLDVWTENLRYWLSQTIVHKLVKEIDAVNKDLARLGSEDQQIGEVGVSLLRSVAYSKGQYVPSLNAIIPYLEVTINQDYLVHRLRELAKDGCIAEFNWKGGSEFRGKAWDEHLPTDAAIMMHLLCTYMDSRMPVNPKYPDGKSFTAQHFMKTPSKPNFANKKDYLCLYQTKESPPHYKVIIGTDVWDVAKGRSNMFHAILRFLHHVKQSQNGMLGPVHLGLSGINILGVLVDSANGL